MFEDDMTYCMSECTNYSCERHKSRVKNPEEPHSYAELIDDPVCPLDTLDERKWVMRMHQCVNDDYEETAHYNADELLCKLLCLLGYKSVVDEWKKVGKWYA